MDKHGFPFLMMVKGMKTLVRSIVLGEKDRKLTIWLSDRRDRPHNAKRNISNLC